jgi:hypothetical protein
VNNLTPATPIGNVDFCGTVYPTAEFCDLLNALGLHPEPDAVIPAPGLVTSPFTSDLEPPEGKVPGLDCPYAPGYHTGPESRAWWMVEAEEQRERATAAEDRNHDAATEIMSLQAQVRTLTEDLAYATHWTREGAAKCAALKEREKWSPLVEAARTLYMVIGLTAIKHEGQRRPLQEAMDEFSRLFAAISPKEGTDA